MGSSSEFKLVLISIQPPIYSHGPNEGNEGDEGRSPGHDGNRSVQRCSGDDRPEGERRQGRCGGHRGSCGRRVEKERLLQTRRRVEHEAQEEASDASPQGCEPIHKGAMRFQSQASFEDSQGIAYEEVEGDDQLEGLRVREGASQHALVDLRASSLAAVGGLTWLSQGHCIIASPDRGSFAYIGK